MLWVNGFMVYAGWVLGLLVFGGFWVFLCLGVLGCVAFFDLGGFGLVPVFHGLLVMVVGFS